MTKKPFVTKEKLEEIAAAVPTPFHIYDEKGIRENAKAVKEAFSWNPGFREYFAVKANPNPTLIKMLGEYDCGCDCSSYTELMLSDAMGFEKDKIMFSSNVTPAAEYQLAAELGAIGAVTPVWKSCIMPGTGGCILADRALGRAEHFAEKRQGEYLVGRVGIS